MSGEISALSDYAPRPSGRRPGRGLAVSSLSVLTTGLASAAAVFIAAALIIVFAATLAVVLVLSAALIATGALALRVGRRPMSDRRLGHSWVAYRLEPRA